MSDLISIDGSEGEGGGQILRSSLGLSIVTRRPIRIFNIRAKRDNPGLMRQHLTSVRAAKEICNAKVKGDAIGSKELVFEPGEVTGNDFQFRIGSAGSTTLVLQTILPPLLLSEKTTRVSIEGGTHNAWAPPVDFLQRSYSPILSRIGPFLQVDLKRHGFYPAGGGQLYCEVVPALKWHPLRLLERGEFVRRVGRCLVSNLQLDIALRENKKLSQLLDFSDNELIAEKVPSSGPGNVVMIEYAWEKACEIATGFGRKGISGEDVVKEVVKEITPFLESDVPVGEYLADQIMLPLGLSAWRARKESIAGGGVFRTIPLSLHSTTHIDILRRFLDIEIETNEQEDGSILVKFS